MLDKSFERVFGDAGLLVYGKFFRAFGPSVRTPSLGGATSSPITYIITATREYTLISGKLPSQIDHASWHDL